MLNNVRLIILAVCICSYTVSTSAAIYKYKDKNDRWQFTDVLVDDKGNPIISEKGKEKKSSAVSNESVKADLKKFCSTDSNPILKSTKPLYLLLQ
ncbi:MAG: hypothetical protein ACI845_004071 [Gammaproteobacteria bacterium]|jgi:hypothetical protein